ncbi:hypothetical protein N2152v2_003028 [Parachlorella kessleri]
MEDQADKVEALVELGAELSFKDKKGLTALHYAAGNGRLDVVKFLWARGAEVDSESPDGCTPLHLAALRGHTGCVTFLLQKGAWIDSEDGQDNTPLHLAASRGQVATVEALLNQGAKPRGVNKHGLTPLGAALVKGQVDVAKHLLSWGTAGAAGASGRATLAAERPGGFSLLHLAAGNGQAAAVELLLEHGADVNDAENPEGATPLHSAVLGGDAVSVGLLLEAGADASAADTAGRLSLDLLAQGDTSKQAGHIRELLAGAAKRGGGKKGGAGKAAQAAAKAPKSPHEAFQALAPKDQRSKVKLWATMAPADLASALSGYPADVSQEVTTRVGQLQALRARINIYKALAAAHADEEFQADAAQPHVREAIEALRKDPSKYERYAADPVTVSVLGKMRRLHGVCQANGQRTLNLDDALLKPGAKYEEEDARQGAALQAQLEGQLAAAVAAAAAGEGRAVEAAAEGYKAGLQAAQEEQQEKLKQRQQRGQPSEASPQGSVLPPKAGAASSASAASTATKPGAVAAGAAPGASSNTSVAGRSKAKRAHFADGDRAAAEEIEKLERKAGEEDDDPNLPEWMKGGFTWKKVWLEFWRQTQLALLLLLAFGLISWVIRGRPPWVGAPRGAPAPVASLIQGAGEGEQGGADLHVDL